MDTNLPKLTPTTEGPYADAAPSFNDPVLRCDGCQKLVWVETITKIGMCPHCSRRKYHKVSTFNSVEKKWMEDNEVDPEFLKLFEPKEVKL